MPCLVATATAANVGSAATIMGNPQNMLIGATSGIPFSYFLLRAGPPALMGLLVCRLVIIVFFPKEFDRRARGDRAAEPAISVAPLEAVVISNMLSNVPALASTFAGNLTLLGSVTNLTT